MRRTRPALTLLLACLVIFALAPAAAAQLPLDPIGAIGDPLGGTTGGSSGGGSGGGGIGDLTGGVDDQEGTSEPDGSADDSDSKLINDLARGIDEAVRDPGTKVDETVEDPSGSVGGTIGDTEKAAAKDVKDFSKGLTDPTRKGGKKKATTDNVGFGHAAGGVSGYDKVFAASLAARLADAKDRTRSTRVSSAVDTEDSGFTEVIQTIGRVAAEAAQQAAFPLLLTLLVGAFLIGQNRIDSRDPKLALAPLDSEQDLLSFT